MLGDDVAAALPDMRAHAESLMIDSVLIERRSGEPTIDPDTYAEVYVYVPVYEGRCKVRATPVQTRQVEAGDTSFEVGNAFIDLPLSDALTGGVRAGDRATVTAAVHDPSSVGRVYVVQRDMQRSYPVERRLFCEEVS